MGSNVRVIPEDRWQEIYTLYSHGSTARDIHKIVVNEWDIEISERQVCDLVKMLREQHKEQMAEYMTITIGTNTHDTVNKYVWLQTELEFLLIKNKRDQAMYLKIHDRLARMYEFQLLLNDKRTATMIKDADVLTDNGLDGLLKELEN